jgi:hypothetical protein
VGTPEPDGRCPRCGTPYAERQEYCLECGQRLPATSGLVAVLGSAWRKRLGWYPGDWIWPTLLALLVAAAAGVASAIWLADSSSSANPTVVGTSDSVSSGHETTTAPEPTVTTSTTATTATTKPAPPPPPPPKVLVAWPPGKNGWTIVLDSIPASNGRDAALAEARQALHLGMKQVGVLDSSRFSSLHPGYFVVFSGIYDTEPAAQSHIIEAHRHGFRGPYPRRITR